MKVGITRYYDDDGNPICHLYTESEVRGGDVYDVEAHKVLKWRKAQAAYEVAQKEMAETINGEGVK